jgi:oligopeptide transport system permease protein
MDEPEDQTRMSATGPAPGGELSRGRSLWDDAWARLRKNRPAVASAVILCFVVLFCVAGPWFLRWNPELTNLDLIETPPGSTEILADGTVSRHWLGTDPLGRDLLVRMMHGGRISLAVGMVATLVALLIGVTYGAIAGYTAGRTDAAMMRFVDILYALPFMIFIILLRSMFGSDILLIFLAIGAVEWLTMARIVRAQVQALSRQEFVEAARSLGLPVSRIVFRHIVPNVIGPVIVYSTLTVPAVMLLEAALSYLGLGVKSPGTSWGALIDYGAKNMETSWWLLTFPAAIFSLTLLSLNFLGDGLRDALDVKTAKD